MKNLVKSTITIITIFILLFQTAMPAIQAMDSEDNQRIVGFNNQFDDKPIEYDIGFVADIMDYLETEIGHDITIPEEVSYTDEYLTVTDSVYSQDTTVTEDVYITEEDTSVEPTDNDIDNLGDIVDNPELRAMTWGELRTNYLLASVYDKILLDRPINYSINKYDFEIYTRFLWLLENENLSFEAKEAVYRGIYYVVSSEYKIVNAAMNDARNLYNYEPTKKTEIRLKQAEGHWDGALDQLEKGNTLPAMISLQHTNFRAHDVLALYGQEYTKENLNVDTDGDGLIDLAENMYNSDPDNPDTDGDNLPDLYEVETTETNPIMSDTDENGISDDLEDFDRDNLTNLEEYNYNTDPYDPDTDKDRLNEYDEINLYNTDPTKYDTDGDSIGDGREIELGLDPLQADTDKDGIPDNEEKILQTINIDEEDEANFNNLGIIPEVSIYGNALEPHTVYLRDAHDLWVNLDSLTGLLGHMVDIETSNSFDYAIISFKYNDKALNGTKPEDLKIVWYDEKNNRFNILPDQKIDKINSKISVTTSHFSIYGVVDYPKLVEAFSKTYDPGRPSTIRGEIEEIILATAFNDSNQGFFNYGYADMSDLEYTKNTEDIYESLVTDQEIMTVDKTETLDEAISYLSDLDNGKWKALIYPIDKETDLSAIDKETIVNQAVENNIKIFPIDSEGLDNLLLEELAEETYGQSFNLSFNSKADAVIVLNAIYEKIKEEEDIDEDGIFDRIEKEGMRIYTGEYLITDPTNKDSDGDSLTDGYEMGYTDQYGNPYQSVELDSMFLPDTGFAKGNTVTISAVTEDAGFNVIKSSPNKPDSDNDSYTDDIDLKPIEPYVTPVFLLHGYKSNVGNVFGAYNEIVDKEDKGNNNKDSTASIYSDIKEQRIITKLTEKDGLAKKLSNNFGEKNIFLFNYANRGDYYATAATFSRYLNNLVTEGKLLPPTKYGEIKIDMVVHSMGGLVARSYIELSQDPNAELFQQNEYKPKVKVRRLITLATPHWGGNLYGISIESLSDTDSDALDMLNPNHCIFRGCELKGEKYEKDYHHGVSFEGNYTKYRNTSYNAVIGDPVDSIDTRISDEDDIFVNRIAIHRVDDRISFLYYPYKIGDYNKQAENITYNKALKIYEDELKENGKFTVTMNHNDDFVTVNSGLGYKDVDQSYYQINIHKKVIAIGPSSYKKNNKEYGVQHTVIHHNTFVMDTVIDWLKEK